MKKQLHYFLTALMFLTRIPVPPIINHSDSMLQKSARYFTWVGLLVGVIAATAYWLLQHIFSPALALAFSMAVSILTTGAFHEDGFADVCDAFGGGWTKEKILLIMKDSRLGTYGVVGLICILSVKFLLLLELVAMPGSLNRFLVIIIAAHGISRLAGLTMMHQYSYVADMDTSKSKPVTTRKLTAAELTIACAGAALPFIFLPYTFLLAILLVIPARLYLGWYFHKWIGGYTGDCLGATQQVTEIFFYIGCLLIWKFI
ncbi:adenosylcobinamide-GDP ribazoletransferase [Foetidibacter luteolus]|uniref:adenosylcobinamide-GDP ribazoletransferase n=1 Tax=Foetidibacter luteolus TaxID=2608880 RepID=UPI00129B98DB|nr:adenosylcobinamide-GDP ribazoletransferase [Foetidibacter luteolus]